MNVVILHYHLNRGGVTRVIENHLLALDAAGWSGRAIVLTGPRREAWPSALEGSLANVDLVTETLPELDYDEGTSFDPGPLTTALRRTLADLNLSPDETLLHVHNHSLGKNLALPAALRALTADGFGVLLHVHDFAEDFRPANYARMATAYGGDAAAELYFGGPRVHYAVLNRRDFDVFDTAGVPSERLHFLPNPVPPMSVGDVGRTAAREKLLERFGVPVDRPFLLYPVRGIQRKNVGEAVLWSAVLGDRADVGITLAPLNPVERAPYDEWVAFDAKHRIGTRFGVGDEGGLAFRENVVAADRVLTTSIAEGFGLTFLEPWTYDRPLVGRNLPEITADFADEGLVLGGLYDRLPIPIEWVGRDTFARTFRAAVDQLGESYARWLVDSVERALARHLDGDEVDYGTLDAAMQRTVIERVANDGEARDRLLASTPAFGSALESAGDVAENRRIVETQYSLAACGRRLQMIYASVLDDSPGPIEPLPESSRVLDAFLDLTRLRLLRC